jgi:beta-1,4-mannosyl-glycoprotein beta-1,4-N-acetylglucosaminyltransferase
VTAYSAVMYSGEADVLEIRLATLDSVIDVHIIAEATLTHAGDPWQHKIRYVAVENLPEGKYVPSTKQLFVETPSDAWKREHRQRQAMSARLVDVVDEDMILVGDVDEIPDPRFWGEGCHLARVGDLVTPNMTMHVGALNWRWSHAAPGTRTRLFTGATFNLVGRDIDRAADSRLLARVYGPDSTPSYGWHLGYLGGVEAIQSKLASFAHQELNVPPFNTREHIEDCLATGADLFGRPECHQGPCPDSDLPPYVVEHRDRFEHLWTSTEATTR